MLKNWFGLVLYLEPDFIMAKHQDFLMESFQPKDKYSRQIKPLITSSQFQDRHFLMADED